MKIPFFSLKEQNERLKSELDAAWDSVCSHGGFVLGKEVEAFESRFAEFIGVPHAIGTSSGLDALTLSLRGLGVGPGDEVILPANTFIATALAVSGAGAHPVLADVNPQTYLLDLPNIQKVLSRKTRAVIPVHLYGQSVDMPALMAIAKKAGFYVIEDAAQAHGGAWQGTRCGAFGDAGAFSFYPSKNLGAFGDGGIITTGSRPLAQRIRALRNYGSRTKYVHETKGSNARLDTLQAAILDVKLNYLQEWNKCRIQLAGWYRERLQELPGLELLPDRSEFENVFHVFPIFVDQRDALRDFLNAEGIGTNIHYPIPIHLQKAYRDLERRKGDLKVCERQARRTLSLPLYPEMTQDAVDHVCQAVAEFQKKKPRRPSFEKAAF